MKRQRRLSNRSAQMINSVVLEAQLTGVSTATILPTIPNTYRETCYTKGFHVYIPLRDSFAVVTVDCGHILFISRLFCADSDTVLKDFKNVIFRNKTQPGRTHHTVALCEHV